MINNKRADIGILPGETLKIILAVICIVILIYLGFYLSNIFIDQKRIEQARSTLEQINIRAELLKENAKEDFLYLAPKDWFIKMQTLNFIKECKSDYCLCLCDEDDCSDLNVCKAGKKIFIIRDSNGGELKSALDAPLTFVIENKSDGYYITKKGESN